MTGQPTLLFCVGATKAGTSWLYDQLAVHPDCHLRSIKELHYFDTVESGRFNWEIRQQVAKEAELAAVVAEVGDARRLARIAERRRDLADWIAVLQRRCEDVPAYLDYLLSGRGKARLVGDVTPSYGLLPVERLRMMSGILPDVRFLYLMRDPVARLWSHVRMLAKRAAPGAGFEGAARRLLARVLAAPEPVRHADDREIDGILRRGDYAGVVARLTAAVDPARLMLMFQEEMTSVPGYARLCSFLGIATGSAKFDRVVHGGEPLAMTAAERRAAAQFLRPQYDAIARLFPALPEAWRRNMAEGMA